VGRRIVALGRDSAPGLRNILLAHGVTIKLLIGLIKAGRATVRSERMLAGGRPTAVTRVRITDAGRRELSGRAKP
jgi:hypothetical protein